MIQQDSKYKTSALLPLTLAAMTLLVAQVGHAQVFHVSTPQQLQNALTLAASNGANNVIYVTNGYYTGNFNFVAANSNSLTIQAETNLPNNQITFDGAAVGRDMSLSNSGTGNFTVSGVTFLRNCGSTGVGALRIAGGGGSSILVQNCQFLSPTNTSGGGIEVDSGLNATITNCVVNGSTTGGGSAGITVAGLTGTVTVQNCVVTTNGEEGANIYVGGGIIINVTGCTFAANSYTAISCSSGSGTTTITGNTFTANTIFNGNGGACSISGSGAVIVSGNTFTGNSATGSSYYDTGNGGAISIYINSTSATITGNTFTGNTAGGNGGAICLPNFGSYNNVPAIITGNTFTGNSAPSGGAIYWYISYGGAQTTIGSNIFIGNTATGSGSGGGALLINNNSGANAMVIGNTFTANSSTYEGGGACCLNGSFSISSNTVSQNLSASGGGLYITGPNLTILDNLVVNNSQTSASSQGGGIWADATSNLYMINNTIFSNAAAGGGGGAAFNVTGTIELLNVYNNLIWGNSASGNGADVWLAGTGQRKVFDYNDASSMYGVWDIAQNNIDLSPQFFNPVAGDYHTQPGSPCINAGTTNAPSLPAFDLDGNPRINLAGMIDMGCYEFNTSATHPADTNADFVITPAEFNAYAAAWKNGLPWTNGPNPGPNPIPANYVTRAGYLMTNGPAYTNDGSALPTNWKLAGH